MEDLNRLTVEQLKKKKSEIDNIIKIKERNITPAQQKTLKSIAYRKDFKEIHDAMVDFLNGISLGKQTIEIPIHVYPNSFAGTFDVEGAVDNIINNEGDFYTSIDKAIMKAMQTKKAKEYH